MQLFERKNKNVSLQEINCEDIISASMSGNVWNTGTGDCYGNSRSEEFDI